MPIPESAQQPADQNVSAKILGMPSQGAGKNFVRLIKHLSHQHSQLLPDDADSREKVTGEPMPAAKRAKADRVMRELLPTLPTAPGDYIDASGEQWSLDAEGCWTDCRGERRSAQYTPIVALMGPMTPVDTQE